MSQDFIEEIEFQEDFPPFKKGQKINLWWTDNFRILVNFYIKNINKIESREKNWYHNRIKLNAVIGDNGVWKSTLIKKITSKSLFWKQIILDSIENKNYNKKDSFLDIYNFIHYNEITKSVMCDFLSLEEERQFYITISFDPRARKEFSSNNPNLASTFKRILSNDILIKKIWKENLFMLIVNNFSELEKLLNDYMKLLRLDYLNYTDSFNYSQLKDILKFLKEFYHRFERNWNRFKSLLEKIDSWNISDYSSFFTGNIKVDFLEHYKLNITTDEKYYFLNKIKTNSHWDENIKIFSSDYSYLSKLDEQFFSLFCGEIKLMVGDISFDLMSSWERILMSRLTNTYMNIVDNKDEFKNFILLIDEPDLHLHLGWQKQYIQRLIDVFSTLPNDIYVQFIISTHSPFIISDLPWECIVRLKGNRKWETKISYMEDNEKTFWANYIDLIQDGFFFEGKNLMGSFAENIIWWLAKEEREKFFNWEVNHNPIKENIWDEFLKQNLAYFHKKKDEKN